MPCSSSIQPDSGGFLEATPLTSFVLMSLVAAGQREDLAIKVAAEDAKEMARRCAREEGLLVGISSGATLAAIKQKYDPTKMVKLAERFFVSLGLNPLPPTFWERSMLTRPDAARKRELLITGARGTLGIAADRLRDFEQDLAVSKRIILEDWRRRSLLQKTRERFWSTFGEVF